MAKEPEEDILSALNSPNPYPSGDPLSTSMPGGSSSPSPSVLPVPSIPNPPALQPIERRIIVWKDGVPVPSTMPVIPKDQIEQLALTALSLPFEPEPLAEKYLCELDRLNDLKRWEEEQKYVGMTNMEVAVIRQAKAAATGDQDALKEMLDRILGKAKQQIDSRSIKMTYADYLKAQAEKDKAEVVDVEVRGEEGVEEL